MNSLTSLKNLKKRFTIYADVTNKSITTNINNRLSVVTEKIISEHKQKLRKKALNLKNFNVPESTNTTSFFSVENSKKDLMKIEN